MLRFSLYHNHSGILNSPPPRRVSKPSWHFLLGTELRGITRNSRIYFTESALFRAIRALYYNTVPLFSFSELVHRSASVDVVWGNAGFPKQKTTKNAEFAKTYPLKTTLKTTNERAILLSSTNGM